MSEWQAPTPRYMDKILSPETSKPQKQPCIRMIACHWQCLCLNSKLKQKV